MEERQRTIGVRISETEYLYVIGSPFPQTENVAQALARNLGYMMMDMEFSNPKKCIRKDYLLITFGIGVR